MCGITGLVDLRQQRTVDERQLRIMAQSILHRGPDQDGFHVEKGLGLASRRLSIVGIADGQQPVVNEDRSVIAVFNGELFDHIEVREQLKSKGHHFRTHTDSEILVHLWEEYGESFFDHLKGQFAFALWDTRKRILMLARDRFGIAPLHWAIADNWLVFGSEIKAILSSGKITPRPDRLGLDNLFTFFCTPGHRTAFEGINSIRPGYCARIDLNKETASITHRQYWDFEFPDRWDHRPVRDQALLASQLQERLQDSIRIRLRADVPVAAYLSGGVDSSIVNTLVKQVSPDRFSTFTARVEKGPSEADLAGEFARRLETDHHDVLCDSSALNTVFPDVIKATDAPVADPNAGSLHQLSRAVRDADYKVALTGEGADEAFAGYIWYKLRFMLGRFDGKLIRPYHWLARFAYHMMYRKAPRGEFERITRVTGGYHAHMVAYHCTSVTRWRLLNAETLNAVQQESAYEQLELDTEKIKRWHPLNQSLYFGYKTLLPGLLLSPRGDRASMTNSVEMRYPFLDENLIEFCSQLHPSMKLKGLTRDKYLLRRMAGEILPAKIGRRRKKMFRAPFAQTFLTNTPAYVDQLLSESSLLKAGYFSVLDVHKLLKMLKTNRISRVIRLFGEMAMCVVLGTQLWHHLYIDPTLCELPAWSPPK